MRFAWLLTAVLVGTALNTQAAQDYSKEYSQCMKFTYGDRAKTEKCVAKELKGQTKILKKSYKNYLKLNANNAAVVKNQHVLFESRLNKQCGRIRAGNYTKIQQGQCALAMVIEQSNYYQSRSFVAKR
ncbi:DUF1311 domain-containing protein [Acinetobacter sp. LoGeW2-3]|uniref:DUF1311 domain-containing protein n=1 Tax=Acinetobacter sp. LoGeW2-3 TaxID=1808001 RepID=UPI000C05B9D9|nr:DUF1311 domain-containing protein [Acinetobacter sp. LoGeW2-3]ATO20391.1 DUF1311 domain-containing protein [Acinetobacter sp. LoGeW2-3]